MEYEERKTMSRKELSELFEKLGADIEKGAIYFKGRIEISERTEVKIEYKERHGRKKFEVEIEWGGGLLSAQAVAVPQIISARQKIASVSQLHVGGAVNFDYRGTPAVLIRLSNGEFHAYSAICTHKGERVEWRGDKLLCPKHNAIFDPATGDALCAPAHEPLKKIEIEVDGEEIFAV